jgi:hypothetical protein
MSMEGRFCADKFFSSDPMDPADRTVGRYILDTDLCIFIPQRFRVRAP